MVNLTDGLANAGFSIDDNVRTTYEKYIPEQKKLLPAPTGRLAALLPQQLIPEMPLDDGLLARSAKDNDMAIITVGKTSGEFADRKITNDFYLTDAEQKMIEKVSDTFHRAGKKVVVILNVCGVIETKSWADKTDAIVLAWLPGQEGGNSVTDILTGMENPSARMPMTWPISYDDVPSKDYFPNTDSISNELLTASMDMKTADSTRTPLENFDYTKYEDGIYVGYRHYTTKKIPVAYPFGYGLSYTTFKYGSPKVTTDGQGNITVTVDVKNTGHLAGKEVVQVYVSAPGKDMDKPERELKGFSKTRKLQPGESQTVQIEIPYSSLSSFNENDNRWQVEEGEYRIILAQNAADTHPITTVVKVNGKVVENVRPCLLEEQK